MRKVALVFTLLLLFCSGLWFWGRPAYTRWKAQRALNQARHFLEQQDYGKARLAVQQTLLTNPTNLQALAIAADLADIAQSESAIAWRSKIADLDPSLENLLVLAGCALRYEKPPFYLASRTLALLNWATNEPAYHVVAAQRASRLKQIPQAEKHLLEAIRLSPTNTSHKLNLAVLRLTSASPSMVAEARDFLTSLTTNEQFGVVAARSLLADSCAQRDWTAALNYSSFLLSHTNVSFADKLQHLSVLDQASTAIPPMQAAGSQLESLLTTLKNQSGTNLNQAGQLANWLNAHGKPSETLQWVPTLAPELCSQQPLPSLMADALMARKDWSGLHSWLYGKNWYRDEFMRYAILSRSMREIGKTDLAKTYWSRALQEAGSNGVRLAGLVALAQRWGWSSEHESLLWSLAKGDFQEKRWALISLERNYMDRGETRLLLQVYRLMLQQDQNSPLAQNNVAAICLLLNEDLENAHRLALKAYEAQPSNSFFASTYAFSLHRQGKNSEGLLVFGKLNPEDLKQPPIAAYYCILLKASGDTETSKRYLSFARRATLLPEERELFF